MVAKIRDKSNQDVGDEAIEMLDQEYPKLPPTHTGVHLYRSKYEGYKRMFPVAKALQMGKISVQYNPLTHIITVKKLYE